MTISSTARVAGPFIGNGTTSTFPFSFKVFEASDLDVVKLTVADGTLVTLALTTDYTVTLNADQDSSPGGSIALVAGNLATGFSLAITTDMAQLQGLDLTNGGAFYPDTVNAALDTLTILVQQLQQQLSRAVQIPIIESASMQLPAAAQRANKVLTFDSNGNISLVTVAAGGTVPGAQTATGAVDGINKAFTFAAAPGATPTPLVFVAGIFQTLGIDYTIGAYTGTAWPINLTTAPAEGPVTILLLA